MFAANAERNLFASSGSAITTDFSDKFFSDISVQEVSDTPAESAAPAAGKHGA